MRLYTYKTDKKGKEIVGVGDSEGKFIHPLSSFGMEYKSVLEMIRKMKGAEWELLKKSVNERTEGVEVSDVILCAPILQPAQDIICLGINYMDHAEESARFKKLEFDGKREYAVYFSKRVNETVPPEGVIPAYEGLVDGLDYEVELAVIIGKDAKNVPKEEAFDYILGYTIMNDVSARNLQTRHKQWYFGKSLDGFTPLGPCIVTRDDLPNVEDLSIVSRLNGEVRQSSNTGLMITGIADMIAELSSGMTLKAGTIIATGTPGGVGMGFVPPRFMKKGDVIECEIEGIGILRNVVGD
ncbi:MAG: fumarylacetoacetate hydrolase family protein [Firmicutes bacterium]|nr:fumarylacetoacetate hydrolase family protein [Bacillota bacterium]